MKMYNAAIDS